MKYLALCLTCLLALTGCQDNPTTTTEKPAQSQPADAKPADAAKAEPTKMPVAEKAPKATSEKAGLNSQNILANHNFILDSVDGQKFSDKGQDGNDRPRPNFDFGQWPEAGGRICNNFRGQVELKDGTLLMKNAAITMMVCPDPDLNQLETTFHSLLNAGVQMEFKDKTLTLKSNEHTLVFILADYVN